MAHKKFVIMAAQSKVTPDQHAVATRKWAHRVGDTVVVAITGHTLPYGTEVRVRTLVPGVAELGYIVRSANDGDFWMRESEVQA